MFEDDESIKERDFDLEIDGESLVLDFEATRYVNDLYCEATGSWDRVSETNWNIEISRVRVWGLGDTLTLFTPSESLERRIIEKIREGLE